MYVCIQQQQQENRKRINTLLVLLVKYLVCVPLLLFCVYPRSFVRSQTLSPEYIQQLLLLLHHRAAAAVES